MRKSRGPGRGSFTPRGARNLEMSVAAALSTERVTSVIAEALKRTFGNSKASAKLVAKAANSNAKTAANWLAGNNAPGAVHLLRLMATVPELQAEVRRLTGMEANIDPEFERDLHALFRTYQRISQIDQTAARFVAAEASRAAGKGVGNPKVQVEE